MMIVVGSANATCGRITPMIEFVRWILFRMMNSGVMATVIGNIRPAAKSANMNPRPRKR